MQDFEAELEMALEVIRYEDDDYTLPDIGCYSGKYATRSFVDRVVLPACNPPKVAPRDENVSEWLLECTSVLDPPNETAMSSLSTNAQLFGELVMQGKLDAAQLEWMPEDVNRSDLSILY